ncbi:hypothetical protein Pcinc_002191 [Petrolisthes cinctipes]|uniref:Uncharacterized protein n=1 Tax=Petrolisthes cinctipes TaxID=88211 RepID=A0AAE1GLH2_PETCI|nr:hypothetical protein Pcinc_002191 [Petrolisthes cinctipes]
MRESHFTAVLRGRRFVVLRLCSFPLSRIEALLVSYFSERVANMMKTALYVLLTVALAVVVMAKPGNKCPEQEAKTNAAIFGAMMNLTRYLCDVTESSCEEKTFPCLGSLDKKDENVVQTAKEDLQEMKDRVGACVTELGFTNINMDAFPDYQDPIEEANSDCPDDLPTIWKNMNVNWDQIVPVMACKMRNKGHLVAFTKCINGVTNQ